jgi:hypothetical protein
MPGAKLETLRSTGQLYFADGTKMRLAASTRLSIQSQSISLEGGSARIDAIASPDRQIRISAGDLRIKAAGGLLQRPNRENLIVTAAATPTEVRNSNGILIAMVRPGQTLAFSVPANSSKSNETRITGKVLNHNGQYFLTDEVTCLKTEIQGGHPETYEGARVQARGELASSATSERRTLLVKELTKLQPQDPAPPANACPDAIVPLAAGAAAAGTANLPPVAAPAAVTAGGLSTTMIVGVTVASVGGLAGTLALVSAESTKSISQ